VGQRSHGEETYQKLMISRQGKGNCEGLTEQPEGLFSANSVASAVSFLLRLRMRHKK
jgi:hypothetical protein